MSRDHARIFTAIWADDHFRARSAAAQRVYMLLLTQKQLSYAGTMELRIQPWSSCSPDTSREDVAAALAELEATKFVVVDEDTEEILIRSYIRRNEIWKQPKLLTLALRQASEIQSQRLRSAVREELLRLPDDRRAEPARTLARTLPDTPWFTPPDTPPDTPARTHSETHADTPREPLSEPLSEPLPEPHPIPPRAHAGARVTSNHEQLTSVVPTLKVMTTSSPAKSNRPDVDAICNHLADRIQGNGSKRPTITDRWRDAARLMLDRDERTEEQIHAAIDWCQTNEFWRANVLSMPTLRDKYDQMRLQAIRSQPVHNAHRSTTDQRVEGALALAAEFEEQGQ